MDIQPNIVVCPHCEKEFTHNKVNGIALLEIVSKIESLKRMHQRLTLNAMERELGVLPKNVRKAVLDGYSDLSRDVHAALGFGLDAE
jgi:hypothetical protein